MIPFTPQKVESASKEAYELFDDREWASLLRRRGFDLTKTITYHVSAYGVLIKQWETPNTIRATPTVL